LPFGSGLDLYDSGRLKGTPNFVDATAPDGLIKLRIMATDGKASAVNTMTIRVKPDPTNEPPVGKNIRDVTATEGKNILIDVGQFFSDPDGDKLDLYISGLPSGSGLTLKDSGMLTGIPVAVDLESSPFDIKILASDRKASTIKGFTLTVLPK
jgi:hypothetical protein